MLAESVGRLPTSLVIILLISLAMAVLSGVVLELSKKPKTSNEFMPFRLESSVGTTSIDLKILQGNWVYQTKDYAMTFTVIGDRFEWIIAFSDIAEAQYYARGNYRIEGDVMSLGVRADLGKPYDPLKPWLKYLPIAMKDINTRISVAPKSFVWNIPASEQRFILSQTSQIFNENALGKFEWVKQ